MWFQPRVLSFITTYQCTAACDQCCFKCSPSESSNVPIDRYMSLIDEAAGLPSIKLIVFTGGECFLLGDALLHLISRATSLGLLTRCVTNGYWATSEKTANKTVKRLVDRGLNEINFSTGAFHSKYVPVENIINGAIACANAGINTVINIELFKESDFDVNLILGSENIQKMVKNKKIQVNQNRWMPNGADILNDEEHNKSACKLNKVTHQNEALRFCGENNKTSCLSSLNILAVTPDLELMSCCGLTLRYMPDLVLGYLNSNTLMEVVENSPADVLKMWIYLDGPEKVIDFIKEHDPSFKLPDDSAHMCHTCLWLYSSENAKRVLLENYNKIESNITDRFFITNAGIEVSNQIGRIYTGDVHLTPPQMQRLQFL